jgi:hypothetical protein
MFDYLLSNSIYIYTSRCFCRNIFLSFHYIILAPYLHDEKFVFITYPLDSQSASSARLAAPQQSAESVSLIAR